MKTCPGCGLASVLVILGALNWGLIGIFEIDLVARVFVGAPGVTRIFYGAIGVAGLLKVLSCFIKCPGCKKA